MNLKKTPFFRSNSIFEIRIKLKIWVNSRNLIILKIYWKSLFMRPNNMHSLFWVNFVSEFYYNIQKCLSVCLYGYRLGSWKCYSLETGIIRTSKSLGVQCKNFFPKSDQWLSYRTKKFCTNAFLWGKFYFWYIFAFILKGSTSSF